MERTHFTIKIENKDSFMFSMRYWTAILFLTHVTVKIGYNGTTFGNTIFSNFISFIGQPNYHGVTSGTDNHFRNTF